MSKKIGSTHDMEFMAGVTVRVKVLAVNDDPQHKKYSCMVIETDDKKLVGRKVYAPADYCFSNSSDGD